MGALLFGFMISNIGSLVSTLDRQSAIIEEKMDQVKEYTVVRGVTQHAFKHVRCSAART